MNYPKPAFMIEDELPSLSPIQTMVKRFEHKQTYKRNKGK